MEHNMILSASGWRKIFTESADAEDSSSNIGETNRFLCLLIAETFAEYIISQTGKKSPAVVVAADTRPTGKEIAQNIIQGLCACGIKVVFLGTAAAPEIMAYSKKHDGFLYISASHNPIGHNGIKFGLNNGGVLEAGQSKILAEKFAEKCGSSNAEEHALSLAIRAQKTEVDSVYLKSAKYKKQSLAAYKKFIREVISGSAKKSFQHSIFAFLKKSAACNPLSIVCDMNGSARASSIDSFFIPECGIGFIPFNEKKIEHAIIPEPENLIHCAKKIQELQAQGNTAALLGYMPDCDGDRGNIVYWNKTEAKTVPAQEVFALCVMSELAFEYWKNPGVKNLAVAVNCPTSMRIDEICSALNAKVFRAEVGEANVVNLARKKRDEGFNVRIFGEGSNGGNITYPSAVRDPVATIFALVKLLAIRDQKNRPGIFHLWCRMSGQEEKYRSDFTLDDVISTLPEYTTTGVSESRALLQVKTQDKGLLKENFRKEFISFWEEKKEQLKQDAGIFSYRACTTNGTDEISDAQEWNNANGGLKVQFLDSEKNPVAFIWMRPSGTEPVFRIMCDVKGSNSKTEKALLQWETELLQKADSQSRS
ncbi:phosphoglucomutase [Treponema sp.]|uniref:phosphoglucomutase n=1 Tax=Treponema sp. TaxID=166 RepID=UPI003F024EE2